MVPRPRQLGVAGIVRDETDTENTRRTLDSCDERDITPREEETLSEKHARLRHVVLMKRTMDEHARLKQELSEEEFMRHPSYHQPTLPCFKGETFESLRKYEVAWVLIFVSWSGLLTDKIRITYAAYGLRGYAQDAWKKEQWKPETWGGYIEFLERTVRDSAKRFAEVTYKLKMARQRPRQSIRGLLRYIEGLEKELPPTTREEIQAYDFLNALRSDLRAMVLQDVQAIESREQIFACARRHEELSRMYRNMDNARRRECGGLRRMRGGTASGGQRVDFRRPHRKEPNRIRPRPRPRH